MTETDQPIHAEGIDARAAQKSSLLPVITPTEPEVQPSEPEVQPHDFEPVMKQPSVRELRAMKRKIMIDSLMSQAF